MRCRRVGSARSQQRWIERREPGRIKWRDVEVARRTLRDQLRHGLARGGRIQDAPYIVPGRNIETFTLRHLADQRQAVLCHRPEAGLLRNDPLRAEPGGPPPRRWLEV